MSDPQLTADDLRRAYEAVLRRPREARVDIVSPATFQHRLECPLWNAPGTPGHVHDRRCGGLDNPEVPA